MIVLPDFCFSYFNTFAHINVIGNAPECLGVRPDNSCVIRFNDWSVRKGIDTSVPADVVFSNGDSHANEYGTKIKWPSRIIFVRRAAGLIKTIPKYYQKYDSLYFMKTSDHDEAQKEIDSSWCTVGFIIVCNLLKHCTRPIHLAGFNWECGKDRFYNHHDWYKEREWFMRHRDRFSLSPLVTSSLESIK